MINKSVTQIFAEVHEEETLAEEDLKQIARYTVKEWGKKQSLKYAFGGVF